MVLHENTTTAGTATIVQAVSCANTKRQSFIICSFIAMLPILFQALAGAQGIENDRHVQRLLQDGADGRRDQPDGGHRHQSAAHS